MTKLTQDIPRQVFAVTIKPYDRDFLKKHNIKGSQIWDKGMKIIREQIQRKERAEIFEKAWNTIYPEIYRLLPEKISNITNCKGTTVQFEPISKETYLEHKKIEYMNIYAVYKGLPENPFEKVDLTPEILIERVKEKIKGYDF
ncbi:MAG: hypothetical protein AYK22_07510 [Thermoplasmatales archaeon SG8-52-3]|nr:MAG: hypothetical protein AYK22_07510 [Thermoplasmatales archaeon SG8-52-3]